MTALPAAPGTAVNRYQPVSVAALARGGTGSESASGPAEPSGAPRGTRSAATPMDGTVIVHGRAAARAFLACPAPRVSLTPWICLSCRISRVSAARGACRECAPAAALAGDPLASAGETVAMIAARPHAIRYPTRLGPVVISPISHIPETLPSGDRKIPPRAAE
jgi:hypothetical protein